MIWHFISFNNAWWNGLTELKKIPPSKIEQNMFQVKINNSQPFKQYFEKIIEIHSCRFGKFLGYARMKLMRQNPALTMLKKKQQWYKKKEKKNDTQWFALKVNYACDTQCCDRYIIWLSKYTCTSMSGIQYSCRFFLSFYFCQRCSCIKTD